MGTQESPKTGASASTKTATYRGLLVWQRSLLLADVVYSFTRRLPSDERYGLIQQMRRAAVSIPSNIAEGHRRGRSGAYLNHLTIASGSHAELETCVELCRRLGLVSDAEELRVLGEELERVGRLLSALIRAIADRSRAITRAHRPPVRTISGLQV